VQFEENSGDPVAVVLAMSAKEKPR